MLHKFIGGLMVIGSAAVILAGVAGAQEVSPTGTVTTTDSNNTTTVNNDQVTVKCIVNNNVVNTVTVSSKDQATVTQNFEQQGCKVKVIYKSNVNSSPTEAPTATPTPTTMPEATGTPVSPTPTVMPSTTTVVVPQAAPATGRG